MGNQYEKPVVEIMQAEDLVESLGATAATQISYQIPTTNDR